MPNSNADEHIPRPSNAWILYRGATLAQLRNTPAFKASGNHRQSNISRIIADMWREAQPEVRAEYFKRAEIEKLEHMERYSEYKYKPKTKAQKSAERDAKLKAKEGMSHASGSSRSPIPSVKSGAYVNTFSRPLVVNPAALNPADFTPSQSSYTTIQGRPTGLESPFHPSANYRDDAHGYYPSNIYSSSTTPHPDPLSDAQLDWFLHQINRGNVDPHYQPSSQPPTYGGSYDRPPLDGFADDVYDDANFEPGGKYFIDLLRDDM